MASASSKCNLIWLMPFYWFSAHRKILPSVLLYLVDAALYSEGIQLEDFIFQSVIYKQWLEASVIYTTLESIWYRLNVYSRMFALGFAHTHTNVDIKSELNYFKCVCVDSRVHTWTVTVVRIIILNAQRTRLWELAMTETSICALCKCEDLLGRKCICNLFYM